MIGLKDKISAQKELEVALSSFETIKAQGDIAKTRDLLKTLDS